MSKFMQFEAQPAKTMLNQVKAPSMPFSWSLNPYRGCQHGCSFCYARSTHDFLGMDTDDTFQRHIIIKENAPEVLNRQIAGMLRTLNGRKRLGSVAIGTATDPYQQIEAKAGLTRRCLEVFADYQVPISITTRSPIVLRDIDLLKRIPHASVNISMNTVNLKHWRNLEPASPSPLKRLETLGTLRENGITAGIFLAPILPFITDNEDELGELLKLAANQNPSFIMHSVLRLSQQAVKVWFFQTLEHYYPEYLSSYADLYQASAYPPAGYRSVLKAKVHHLLEKYGLAELKAYSERVDTTPKREEAPVQLSFSF